MKKISFLSKIALVGLTSLSFLTACGGGGGSLTINVVSREDGSGTRGAFVELFEVLEKNEAGEKVDLTSDKAMITNSTAVMLTTISGDKAAIGYVSMGSLDESVKAVAIDGVAASVETIKDESYKISRPFNIVTTKETSPAATDFITFILSQEGQAVVEETGYIAVEASDKYTASVDSGKVVVSGSSSVTPVMEKLKESYQKVNPGVTVEVQQSDSSTGITNAIEGTADIGMSSRALEDEETAKGVQSTVIAMDGIAVIVNKENKVDELTSQEVKDIFKGEITSWDGLSD